jgi:hypothetical protein
VVVIDPNKNPVGVNERLHGETNPTIRRMLEEVRFHIAVEAALDIDSAIARMAPKCEYVLYYSDSDVPVTISGHSAVRFEFYDKTFQIIDPRLEWDIVRCGVGENFVITEGRQKSAMRGTALIEQGVDADPNGLYLRDERHLVIWPFDSQLRLIGETVYIGPHTMPRDVVKRPLKPEDIATYTGPRYDIS